MRGAGGGPTFKDLRMKALDKLGTTANQHFKEVGNGNKYCESQNSRMWPLINTLVPPHTSPLYLLRAAYGWRRTRALGSWGNSG